MTDSIETSEDLAQPFDLAPAMKSEPVLERDKYAVQNPDVLHTPAMYREIIKELLELV